MAKDKVFGPIEIAKEIERVKLNMPLQFQAQALQAQGAYNYFLELQKAGFTAEQALEIIKARGTN